MKVKAILVLVIATIFSLFIVNSYAAITLSDLSDNVSDGIKFKPSKDVTVKYGTDTNRSVYGVSNYHAKGTKTYATGSGESKIYYYSGTNASVTITDNGTVSGGTAD